MSCSVSLTVLAKWVILAVLGPKKLAYRSAIAYKLQKYDFHIHQIISFKMIVKV